jgi:NitT/TauT family transport system substrate-binding protein
MRWRLYGFGLLVAALLGAGCGRSETEAGAVPAEVRVGYFANLTHAQAVLGVESGEFQRALGPATRLEPGV